MCEDGEGVATGCTRTVARPRAHARLGHDTTATTKTWRAWVRSRASCRGGGACVGAARAVWVPGRPCVDACKGGVHKGKSTSLLAAMASTPPWPRARRDRRLHGRIRQGQEARRSGCSPGARGSRSSSGTRGRDEGDTAEALIEVTALGP